jgi:hypothetical protein
MNIRVDDFTGRRIFFASKIFVIVHGSRLLSLTWKAKLHLSSLTSQSFAAQRFLASAPTSTSQTSQMTTTTMMSLMLAVPTWAGTVFSAAPLPFPVGPSFRRRAATQTFAGPGVDFMKPFRAKIRR